MQGNVLLTTTLFVMAGITLLLGIFVLRKGPRRIVHQRFFYWTTLIVFWLLTNAFAQFADSAMLTFWIRTTFLTASLMLLALVDFFLVYPRLLLERLRFLRFVLPWPALAIAALSMGNLMVESVQQENGVNIVSYGPLFPVFIIYVLLVVIGVIAMMFWHFRHSIGGMRQQIEYMMMGITLAGISAIATDLLAPLAGNELLPNFGPLGIIFVVGFTSYTIIAHRLFDIRVIVRKTVIYSGLLAFVIGVYSLVIFTLATLFGAREGASTEIFLSNLIAAVVVAFGFEPIRRWLVKTTDKYLFVGEYRPEDVIRELSQNLSGVIDLDEALQGMMQILVKNMRLKRAATFVLRRYKEGVEVKRVKSIGFEAAEKLKLEKNDPLISHFESRLMHRKNIDERRHIAVVTEELARRIEEGGAPSIVSSVHKRLVELGAAVALPMIVNEQLIGILILSDKLSGGIYTSTDLDFLEIVAHETAGAIEKARFWEEDQLKSEFVSIASHELLTPTSTIQGYLSMILDEGMGGKIDPKAREYLELVRGTSKRLTTLVQDLLSVSRIESGRIKINPVPMDLLAAIHQVVTELTPQAHQKGLSLHFEDPGAGQTLPIFADPERTRQVLVNIIGNGVKYTPKGGVTVSVTQSGRMAECSVADTGFGMTPEERKHLFEKFYRIQNDQTHGITGTGLGLYIAKHIVELMGGKIEVESISGKGSTFTVILPTTDKKNLVTVSEPAAPKTQEPLVSDDKAVPQASVKVVSAKRKA